VAAYSQIKATRQRQGLGLDENDLWIAATAKALGAVLVSSDRDFCPGRRTDCRGLDPVSRPAGIALAPSPSVSPRIRSLQGDQAGRTRTLARRETGDILER
jgi:hypothetical protein